MQIDTHKVDLILQYALLTAGEEDDYMDRDLGPIHLLKYVYLADLAYAERQNGETFTGTPWQFYKFGPWSQAVHERIEEALNKVQADKSTFQSDYEGRDDWCRWTKRDERLLSKVESQLPLLIVSRLKRDVHKYGKDTSSLLDYVYKTSPMLSAAPMEFLDFSLAIISPQVIEEPEQTKFEQLSKKKKKCLSTNMASLREKAKNRPAKSKLINPVQKKIYDDDLFEVGVKWLDEEAGPMFTEQKATVHFSDNVWKSEARKGKGDDVS